MRNWSQVFVPTLREAPAEAEIASHKLLLRAGYVRQLASGLYSYLFLGRRAVLKIAAIVRQEMDRFGQEVCFPSLHPRDLQEPDGPWQMGDSEIVSCQDRAGRSLFLASTDADVVVDIARKDLRSYKQLPQTWYQIANRYRDDARSRSGLFRLREFTVCDSYSLDLNDAALDATYGKHHQAYCAVLERCGLEYLVVEGSGNPANTAQRQDFMVLTPAGQDMVASCSQCGYAANLEVAGSRAQPIQELESSSAIPLDVATPAQKTIDEVASFLGVQPAQVIKSYLAVASCSLEGGSGNLPVVVFLRGDHSVNESKLHRALAAAGFLTTATRPMEGDEIRECFALEPGFIGPAGFVGEAVNTAPPKKWMKPQVLFDLGLRGCRNMVAGGNRPGFHRINVTPNEASSFTVRDEQWVDTRNASEGDGCPTCGSPLMFRSAIKVACISKLSGKYSESTGVRVSREAGREAAPSMGSYRIWLDRILASCVEQNHDENGFWLLPSIAPFQVVVTPTNVSDARIKTAAERIARDLDDSGVEVLLDDREERPGVKFKDADLIGIPYRINVGKKIAEGETELVVRARSMKENVGEGEIATIVRQKLKEQRPDNS